MHQPEIHVTIGASEPTPHTGRARRETKRGRGMERTAALKSLTMGRQTVYALRLSDGVIKIGCTAKLWQRRNKYPGSEVIGFAFGDFSDEAAIHATLKPFRTRGHEYYEPAPEVMAVVNRMRDMWNLPHVEK